jgi:hypothetical protein
MGSKNQVVAYAHRAIASKDNTVQLENIARAIAELADFVDDLENQLRRIENNRR